MLPPKLRPVIIVMVFILSFPYITASIGEVITALQKKIQQILL